MGGDGGGGKNWHRILSKSWELKCLQGSCNIAHSDWLIQNCYGQAMRPSVSNFCLPNTNQHDCTWQDFLRLLSRICILEVIQYWRQQRPGNEFLQYQNMTHHWVGLLPAFFLPFWFCPSVPCTKPTTVYNCWQSFTGTGQHKRFVYADPLISS